MTMRPFFCGKTVRRRTNLCIHPAGHAGDCYGNEDRHRARCEATKTAVKTLMKDGKGRTADEIIDAITDQEKCGAENVRGSLADMFLEDLESYSTTWYVDEGASE